MIYDMKKEKKSVKAAKAGRVIEISKIQSRAQFRGLKYT